MDEIPEYRVVFKDSIHKFRSAFKAFSFCWEVAGELPQGIYIPIILKGQYFPVANVFGRKKEY